MRRRGHESVDRATRRHIARGVELAQQTVHHQAFTVDDLAQNAELSFKFAEKYGVWTKLFEKLWESDSALRESMPDWARQRRGRVGSVNMDSLVHMSVTYHSEPP